MTAEFFKNSKKATDCSDCMVVKYFTMAKTEIIYPKNVGASVAMNFI